MPREEIEVGSYWRKTSLGTSALYQVVVIEGEHVTVEAHDVPGLPSGVRLRFLAKAFQTMERVPPPAKG
jgi:hypothetical protein